MEQKKYLLLYGVQRQTFMYLSPVDVTLKICTFHDLGKKKNLNAKLSSPNVSVGQMVTACSPTGLT